MRRPGGAPAGPTTLERAILTLLEPPPAGLQASDATGYHRDPGRPGGGAVLMQARRDAWKMRAVLTDADARVARLRRIRGIPPASGQLPWAVAVWVRFVDGLMGHAETVGAGLPEPDRRRLVLEAILERWDAAPPGLVGRPPREARALLAVLAHWTMEHLDRLARRRGMEAAGAPHVADPTGAGEAARVPEAGRLDRWFGAHVEEVSTVLELAFVAVQRARVAAPEPRRAEYARELVLEGLAREGLAGPADQPGEGGLRDLVALASEACVGLLQRWEPVRSTPGWGGRSGRKEARPGGGAPREHGPGRPSAAAPGGVAFPALRAVLRPWMESHVLLHRAKWRLVRGLVADYLEIALVDTARRTPDGDPGPR